MMGDLAGAGVDRRAVLAMGGGAAAMAAAGCASAGETPPAALKSVDASTPERVWAHQHLRGMANLFFPTFKPDLAALDEEGVRRDVRAAVAQGFCGTMPMLNWTRPDDPRWEVLHRAVIDEARGKLPVHGVASLENIDADIELIRRIEKMGADMILLAPYHAADISAEDLLASYKRRIAATGLPVILYAATGAKRNFPHLGPSGQPLDVFDRLADLPNVVAMKISQPITLTSTMQMCDVVADRLLVAPVNLDFAPALSRLYPIQWSGQWNAEAVQTPDNQLGNKLLAACAAGDTARIDAAAREIQAVHDAFYNLQASVIRSGAHPVQHNKYYSWLGGGNGGILPNDPHAPAGAVPVLDAGERKKLRAAFKASGLVPTDAPEEQFVVGRAAWERGARVKDMAGLPNYRV